MAPPPPTRGKGVDAGANDQEEEPQPIDIRARIAAFSGGASSSAPTPPSKLTIPIKPKVQDAHPEEIEDSEQPSSSPPVTGVRNIIARYAGGAAAGPSSSGLSPRPNGQGNSSRAASEVGETSSSAVASKSVPPQPPALRPKPATASLLTAQQNVASLQPPTESSSGLASAPSSPRPASVKPAPPPTPARPPADSGSSSSLNASSAADQVTKSPAPPSLPPRKPTALSSSAAIWRPRTAEKSRSDGNMEGVGGKAPAPALPNRVVSDGSPTMSRGGGAPALPPRQGTELSTPSRGLGGRRRGSDSAVSDEANHGKGGMGLSPQVPYAAYRSRSPAGMGNDGLRPAMGGAGAGPTPSPRPKPAIPARSLPAGAGGESSSSSTSLSAALASATSTSLATNLMRSPSDSTQGPKKAAEDSNALLPSPHLTSGALPPPPQRTNLSAPSNGALGGLSSNITPGLAASSALGMGGRLGVGTAQGPRSRDRSKSSASMTSHRAIVGATNRERRGSVDQVNSPEAQMERGASAQNRSSSSRGGGQKGTTKARRSKFKMEEPQLRFEVHESRKEGYERLWQRERERYAKWLEARRKGGGTEIEESEAPPASSALRGEGEESPRATNLKDRIKAFENPSPSPSASASASQPKPSTPKSSASSKAPRAPKPSVPSNPAAVGAGESGIGSERLPSGRIARLFRQSRLPDTLLARIWLESGLSTSSLTSGKVEQQEQGAEVASGDKESFMRGLAAIDGVLEDYQKWKEARAR